MIRILFLLQLFLFAFTPFLYALEPEDIYKKVGSKIDLNLTFTNQDGKTLTLKQFFNDNDVLILTLNYYRCTTMCTYQLMNLATSLKDLGWQVGHGYSVATVSFDPSDTPARAQNIRNAWLSKLGTPNAPWHFYTGDKESIKRLADSLNFYYQIDDEGNFAHAGALFFITKDGTFKKYLYGIVYDARSLKNSLIELSNGKLGNLIDKTILKFYRYDLQRGKYFSKISLE